jgi:tRNA(Ile)-lysidine synthetase-like protein
LHYTRNRVRTNVLPALAALNPRVVESISRAAESIAGDQDVLDMLACSLLRTSVLASHTWRDRGDQSTVAYSVTALLEQPLEMRRRMIIESIRQVRDAAKRDGAQDCEVTSVHVAAVEELLRQNSSGKHITLPCSLEVWREFDALVIRIVGTDETPYLSVISSTRAIVEAGGFTFTLERGLGSEVLGSVKAEARHERQATGRDWMAVALDDLALPDELVIRPRLRGERAHIAGHRRTIKLKNLMIDHRIPSSRRATWPIVATPDGAYIWSPGLPPAVKFAAQAETDSLAMLRARAI